MRIFRWGLFIGFVALMGCVVFAFLPLVILYVVHGWLGWLLAVPAEIIWLVFIGSELGERYGKKS